MIHFDDEYEHYEIKFEFTMCKTVIISAFKVMASSLVIDVMGILLYLLLFF